MKSRITLISLLCMACGFSACSDDEEYFEPTVQYIELSETQKTVKVGESWQLTATVTPEDAVNKKVVWSNLHPEIGSVDQEGNVSAVGVGVDSIFATVDNVTALCIMQVKPIAIDSLTLNAKEKVLGKGETFKLTATITPENATNKTVSWTSSETTVATVDDKGNVTAVAEGNTVITAKAGMFTATCKILVVGNELTVTPATCELMLEESQELALNIPPRMQGKTVEWKSEDVKVATVVASEKDVTKATVAAVQPGTTTVTATVGGETVKCVVTVKGLEGGLSFAVTEMNVEIGMFGSLELDVPARLEGKAIQWTSSNPEIATVETSAENPKIGCVTPVKVGVATIQAAVEGETVTCKVTVTKSPVYVEGTKAILRLNLMGSEADVASAVQQLDAKGITEYKLIGNFKLLGEFFVKPGAVKNIFANTKAEVIDLSAIDVKTLPVKSELPALPAHAFDQGGSKPIDGVFTNLKKVILPEGLKVIEGYAFQGSKAEEIDAPGVTKIMNSAFAYGKHIQVLKLTASETITCEEKTFGKDVKNTTLYLNEKNKKMVAADGKVFNREWKEVIFVK